MLSSPLQSSFHTGEEEVICTLKNNSPQLLQELPDQPQPIKKKRNQPGNPDPDAEVIALSPRALVTSHRYVCEVCNKGFQRDQNLQLHRRGHNLPWQLRPRGGGVGKEAAAAAARKRVYVCPEKSCVHHHPSRALGDLTGIKKHFSRKHGEKKWKCDKCGKRYAVHSDWKAHVKNCGTREYKCDCGIVFPRKDTLINHRAFCDALAEESARLLASSHSTGGINADVHHQLLLQLDQDSITVTNPLLQAHLGLIISQRDHSSRDNIPATAVAPAASPAAMAGVDIRRELESISRQDPIPVISWDPSSVVVDVDRQLTRDFLGVTPPEQQVLIPLAAAAGAIINGYGHFQDL